MENPELLKFVSDNLKNNKFVNIQLKNLSLVIRNVPDQYKTQQMCDKAILENGGTLESAPDCYKINKCLIKLLIITLMYYNLSLIAISLKTCVIKLPILMILQFNCSCLL